MSTRATSLTLLSTRRVEPLWEDETADEEDDEEHDEDEDDDEELESNELDDDAAPSPTASSSSPALGDSRSAFSSGVSSLARRSSAS